MSKQKRVWLHRIEPNNGNLPEDVQKNATRRISSVYVNRKPLKGLEPEEEKALLPRIIDASADEGSQFHEKASKYWKELSIDVPSGGKDLNISTRGKIEQDGEEVPDPVHTEDFIMYRFAKNHPQVAESKTEAQRHPNKLYYILDPEEEKKKQRKNVEAKKQAWKEFIKMEEDEEKIDLMIRVFTNSKPEEMTDFDEKINTVENELEKRPQEFVEVAQDEDLEMQDFVLQCIEHGVLREVGNQIMYMDENIGSGVDQVVAYLKNKRNSSVYSEMKARLQESK